ncbi:MAG: YbaK/EbsC family protein [Sphaerochaetaceae bacterium]|jgi:Cys-tRNA(Pro) deacylase
MSFERAYNYLKQYNLESKAQQFTTSSATVALAAAALGTEEARIAKTLAFDVKGKIVLVVAAGDTKIDNKKFKQQFSAKAKMLDSTSVYKYTGYHVGGVCPFDIDTSVEIFIDDSVKRFETVFPACGSDDSAVELTIDQLYEVSKATGWVSVTLF